MPIILWLLFVLPTIVVKATGIPSMPASDPSPYWTEGKATFYSRGLMQEVADTRGITLGIADGYATYPDCSMIGRYLKVSVFNPTQQKWSAWSVKRIVDCSQDVDYQRHIAEGLVELSYEDAHKYGYLFDGHTRIRFYLANK